MRFPWAKLWTALLGATALAGGGFAQSTALFTISAPSPAAAPAGSGALTVSLTVRQNYETTFLQQYGLCLYTGVASTAVARSASSSAGNPSFTVPATDFDIPPASFSNGRYSASLNLQVVGTACSATSSASNSLVFPLSYPSISSVSLAALAQPNAGVGYATYPTSLEINGANLTPASGASFTFTGQSAPVTSFAPGTYLGAVGSLVVAVPQLAETGATGVSLSACNMSAHYRYCSPSATLASFALAPTTTQVTSSVSSPVTGQATTLMATVAPGASSSTAGGVYAPGAPGGLVTFSDGGTSLGTARLVGSSLTFAAASSQTISAPSNSGARVGAKARRRRTGAGANDTPSPDNSTGFSSIVTDFNLDGAKDALVIDANSGNFHVLLGASPAGNFQAEHLIASGCSYLAGATVADLNGDTFPDIAYLCLNDNNTTSMFALYNLGDGTFGPATAMLDAAGAPLLRYGGQIGAGDVNKDGKTDLVVTGVASYLSDGTAVFGIQTFLGDGTGRFTAGSVSSTPADPGLQLVVKDVNNDGADDLVLLSSSSTTYVTAVQTYLNNGSGSFASAASLPVCDCFSYTAKLFVTPVTANSLYPDIVVAAPDQEQVLVALNRRTAAGTFAPAVAASLPNLADAVVGDLNGDGLADLVIFDGSRITTLTGDGSGRFSAQPSSPDFSATGYSAANVSLVAATDVNQDGYADLIAIYPGSTFTSTINSFVTTGTAVASLPATFSSAGPHRITTAYPGTATLLGSNGALSLTVTQAPPAYMASLSVTAPPSTSPGSSATKVYTPGGTFSLNFTVSQTTDPGNGAGYRTPGGTITVSENGVSLGSASPASSGPGTSTASLNNFGAAFAGVHTFTIVYSGDTNFSRVTSTYTYTVTPALPSVTWPIPATTSTNAPLDSSILNATSSVAGGFAYTPASGYLGAGQQTITAVFTPTDSVDYQTVSTSRTINVLKANVSSSSLLATPVTQTYLSGVPTVLTATFAGANLVPTGLIQFFDGGVFLGSSALAAAGPAATGAATLSLPALAAGGHAFRATYAGDPVYNAATPTLSYTVGAATPVLSYNPVPSTLAYGTALVAGQFDAVAMTAVGATVPGTFAYNHAVGDILMAGSQTLTATFTPSDAVSFLGGTVSSVVNVTPSAAGVTLAISSGGNQVVNVASGGVVALTATVLGVSGSAVTGQVNFCDASASFCTDIHLLGSAQLTPAGTATLRLIPGIGVHRYRAVLVGTADYPSAASASMPLTVTGSFGTSTTLAASGTSAGYVLTATVSGFGSPVLAPSGSVSFLDATNANNPVASAGLGTAVTTQTFANQAASGVTGSPLATGDFNGDGIADVITGSSSTGASQTLSVYLGKGDGTFTLGSTVNAPAGQAVTGDFNHDGVLDLAVSASGSNTISLLLGKGDGSFTVRSTTSVPSGIGTLVVGDFNRDGLLDLATGSTTANSNSSTATGTLTVLLGAGDGTFTTVQTATPMSASLLATADFNGDGVADLVAGDFYSQTASVFLGKGDGTFALKSTNTLQSAQSTAFFATADYNGDGIADIASLDFYTNTVTILLGNGDGTFTQKTTFSDPTAVGEPNAFNLAAGDFNQDGIADLAVTADDGVSVYLGAGDGTFTISTRAVPQTIATETQGHEDFGLLLADFNGDGLLDLATGAPDFIVALNTVTATATATASNVALAGYGPHAITASYAGDVNFAGSASAAVPLTGQPVAPILLFNPTPTSLTYGTPLPTTLFNAVATTPGGAPLAGVITYNHAAGDLLAAGAQTLTATFTPADSLTYIGVSVSRIINISRATPTLRWTPPASITQGTPLSSAQLNASAAGYNGADLPGTFTYTPAAGTILASGVQTLSVLFTPADATDYVAATGSVPLTVNIPAARVSLGSTINPTQYGQPTTLSASVVPGGTLTAVPTGSVSFLDGAKVLGTTSVSPAGVATLSVNALTAGTHSLTAAYLGDAANAMSTSSALSQTVNQAVPVITFAPNPSTLPYGTPLSGAQLDASAGSTYVANVPGAFAYSYAPAFTTIPGAGMTTITATFTPTDPVDFSNASGSATIVVTKATPVISFPTPPTAIVGTPLSALQLSPTVTGVAGPNLPGSLSFAPNTGLVAAGAQTLTVTFTPADSVDYNVATTTVVLNGTAVTLTGLSSSTAQLGDPARTLTLTGTGFVADSVARANGGALVTTFVNSTTLSAVLPAANFLAIQTLQISVFNASQNQTTASLPFSVVPAPVGPISFTGPATVNSGDQPILRFSLANPYPVDLTATVTLTFMPIAGGVDDPAIQFRNGGRTFSFRLAAGQTVSPTIQLQSGTVAGTLQATLALFITNGLVNVTPASAAPIVIAIPAAAPAITSLTVTRTGRQLVVNTYGFANTRAVTQATFHFTPAAGQQIQTPDITLDVTGLFSGWYGQAVSATYGSAFLYTQTFTLDEDATIVGQVTVTLSNGVGTSASGSSN